LGIFLFHLNKKSHLMITLLLHSFDILDTFFLVRRCMVLNLLVHLGMLLSMWAIQIIGRIPPLFQSLWSQILWLSLRWQRKIIYCFYWLRIHKKHSHYLPTSCFFFQWGEITIKGARGSKLVTRSQKDYFGKGFQGFFPKKHFYMQMNFWMNLFVTCCKKY
jgi:hypothetical protein